MGNVWNLNAILQNTNYTGGSGSHSKALQGTVQLYFLYFPPANKSTKSCFSKQTKSRIYYASMEKKPDCDISLVFGFETQKSECNTVNYDQFTIGS